MATEICKLCLEEGTPWTSFLDGHICCNCSYGLNDSKAVIEALVERLEKLERGSPIC